MNNADLVATVNIPYVFALSTDHIPVGLFDVFILAVCGHIMRQSPHTILSDLGKVSAQI